MQRTSYRALLEGEFMFWVVVVVVLVVAVGLVSSKSKGASTPQSKARSNPPSRPTPRGGTRPATSTRSAVPPRIPATPSRPEYRRAPLSSAVSAAPDLRRMPFATPGMRGQMFSYAGSSAKGATYDHHGPFAVLDFQTTGLAPGRGDRVVEVAVVRVDLAGDVVDEFATLVNPERDTGVPFLHGITDADVADAPTFKEVMPELLSRLSGAVVVAHNAPFEEAFLAAELRRAGVNGLRMPALCTLWFGQKTFSTPNHKLWTLARDAGFPILKRYVALGHARTEAKLLGVMLDWHGQPLAYDCPTYAAGANSTTGRVDELRVVTRAVSLRKGTDGWMHSLMARLPMSANEADDATVEVYLDALAEVMADGRIDAEEAKRLASLAGSAGLGATQVAALNERFLESMREAAYADDILTGGEIRELKSAAKALGVPDYFDDLTPSATRADPGQERKPAGPGDGDVRVRRCGHCRQPGHYRKTCPDIVGV